jgi:hypothetical protein
MSKSTRQQISWELLTSVVIILAATFMLFSAIDFSAWGKASARNRSDLNMTSSQQSSSRTYNNLGKAVKAMFYEELRADAQRR